MGNNNILMGNKQLVVFLRGNHRRCTKIRESPSGISPSLSEGFLGFSGEQSIIRMYLQPTLKAQETKKGDSDNLRNIVSRQPYVN